MVTDGKTPPFLYLLSYYTQFPPIMQGVPLIDSQNDFSFSFHPLHQKKLYFCKKERFLYKKFVVLARNALFVPETLIFLEKCCFI